MLTVALTSGLPFLSETTPATVLFWAKRDEVARTNAITIAIARKNRFLLIQQDVLSNLDLFTTLILILFYHFIML